MWEKGLDVDRCAGVRIGWESASHQTLAGNGLIRLSNVIADSNRMIADSNWMIADSNWTAEMCSI